MKVSCPILSLPTEMHFKICELLSRKDMKSLRKTCKQWDEVSKCSLFSSININITNESQNINPSQIQSLTAEDRDLARYVQNLCIHVVHPRCSRSDLSVLRNPIVEPGVDEMSKSLFKIISSMSRLRTLRFLSKDHPKLKLEPAHNQFPYPGWALQSILQAASALPHLETFQLVQRAHHPRILGGLGLDSLSGFSTLRHLSLTLRAKSLASESDSLLLPILSHNLKLAELDISVDTQYATHDGLEFFVQRYPLDKDFDKLTHTSLTTLTLEGCSFLYNSLHIVPCLQNLRSFQTKSCSLSTNSTSFWDVLHHTGTRLHSISVDRVDRSLITYLSLYSGLKEINVEYGVQTPEEEVLMNDNLAEDFYACLARSHTMSLEKLYVKCDPFRSGLWCCTPGNAHFFGDLKQIRELFLSVNMVDIEDSSLSTTGPAEVVKTVMRLPHLTLLGFCTPATIIEIPQMQDISICELSVEEILMGMSPGRYPVVLDPHGTYEVGEDLKFKKTQNSAHHLFQRRRLDDFM